MHPAITQLAIVAAAFGVALVFVFPCARIAGNEAERSDRYRHLDGMRGLAAVGVVAAHVGQYAWACLGNTEQPLIVNHVGILGVEMFFALVLFPITSWSYGLQTVPGKLLACGGVVGQIILVSGFTYRWIELPWLSRPPSRVRPVHEMEPGGCRFGSLRLMIDDARRPESRRRR